MQFAVLVLDVLDKLFRDLKIGIPKKRNSSGMCIQLFSSHPVL